MKTQSAKNKGRSLQKLVCKELLRICEPLGIEADDILSRSMGANGEDVILSPSVRKLVGDLKIECKNRESLNVTGTFLEHAGKYPNNKAVLVHKRNFESPLVTISLQEFISMLERIINASKDSNTANAN